MHPPVCFEQYPIHFVNGSTLLSLSIYAIGAFILYQAGFPWLVLYFLSIGILEVRLLGRSCVSCCYYGKTCAFGKDRLCSMVFPRKDPQEFLKRTITWIDILPDFLVFIIPILVGILLLLQRFSIVLFILIIILFLLGSPGNAIVRGQLTCKYCKQREWGCPAEQLFDKTENNNYFRVFQASLNPEEGGYPDLR